MLFVKGANAIRKRANAIRPYVRFYRYMKHFSPFFEQLFYVVVFRYALSLPCKRKKNIFSFSGNIYTLK